MAARPTPTGPAADRVEGTAIEPEAGAARRAESGLATPTPAPVGVGPQLLMLGLNLVAPIAVYYTLHSGGVGNVAALSAAAIPPGLGAAVKIVRERKVDRLAVMVVASMLAAIGVSFITGSPRFVLAKDGWIMGLWGVWFLFSVRAERPAAFLFTRPILEGRKAFTVESWDSLWEQVPAFRRIWRTSTIMWGLGLMVDAVVRVTMAYTLPVAVVPGLGGALYPATFVALQVITNIYYHHAGLWTVLGARWDRSSRRFST
jgi:hypothetical protein